MRCAYVMLASGAILFFIIGIIEKHMPLYIVTQISEIQFFQSVV